MAKEKEVKKDKFGSFVFKLDILIISLALVFWIVNSLGFSEMMLANNSVPMLIFAGIISLVGAVFMIGLQTLPLFLCFFISKKIRHSWLIHIVNVLFLGVLVDYVIYFIFGGDSSSTSSLVFIFLPFWTILGILAFWGVYLIAMKIFVKNNV